VGLLYEDVGQGLSVALTFWFFLTPVIYPWPRTGGGAWLVAHNPLTPVLHTTRAWLTGAPGASPWAFAAVSAGAAALLLAAIIAYRVARPHLVARL
jgi:lipopolysaccharide transport system permease protein